VAAVIVEPVQGEGGYYPAPAAFLQGLRERCTRHGILLIVDEVQSGYGRTGDMWAFQESGIVPDVVCVAKAIANGLPLTVTGVLKEDELADIEEIEAAVTRVVEPLGRRVDVVVNYDHFSIRAELVDAYSAMVERLTGRFYHRVTRYAANVAMAIVLRLR